MSVTSRGWRWLRWTALIALGVIALLLVPATVLLVWGETWRGRMFGAGAIIGALMLVALASWGGKPRGGRPVAALGALTAIAFGIVLATAPAGPPPSRTGVSSIYLSGGPDRFALGHIIPEIDQVAVGTRVV